MFFLFDYTYKNLKSVYLSVIEEKKHLKLASIGQDPQFGLRINFSRINLTVRLNSEKFS